MINKGAFEKHLATSDTVRPGKGLLYLGLGLSFQKCDGFYVVCLWEHIKRR
jgi:hypothetical protein